MERRNLGSGELNFDSEFICEESNVGIPTYVLSGNSDCNLGNFHI
ncbi:hypothetical protein [Leptospira selangorensis]|nr:hypothetical protein [Leptospira selangorensis]